MEALIKFHELPPSEVQYNRFLNTTSLDPPKAGGTAKAGSATLGCWHRIRYRGLDRKGGS